MDVSLPMPMESQWDLLSEHNLSGRLDTTWIDTEDIEEIVQRFHLDAYQGISCNLDTAFNEAVNDTQDDTMIWIGTHSPGWSVAVAIHGWLSIEPEMSAGRRRIFTHMHMDEVYKLPNEGMLYYYDGELIGSLGVIEEFQEYTHDLDVGWSFGFRATVESCLILAGRITGRFLDREWFAESRVLYRVPRDA
ncbi:hypothetical protein [Nonomuraea aridisoli]|uniref:hypothetical protein n=1 Tax=Nonomuraea aridisoli TaxID=2070368 RepID=UPI0011B94A0E|nr:hypothetical protein [Nonomuraea aridisoli]